jgi:hypothetical protein
MRDREPAEYSETQMILIPVIVEAVGAIVFIACSMLLVVLLSTAGAPV